MQTKLTLILLLSLYQLSKSESDYCAEKFDSHVGYYCRNLYINSTHNCAYSNGKCDYNYISCTSYQGTDESTCKNIILSNNYKKCILDETNENKCTEVSKDCDDYASGLTCSSLNAGTGKRCVSNNDNDHKCEAHYDLCADFRDGVDKIKCEANIPSDSSKKCEWDSTNNICKDVDKKCTDYTSLTPHGGCSSLKTSDDTKKICISSSSGIGCTEQYMTCKLYNENESSKSKTACETIQIYSGGSFDDSKKCSFSGTTCSTKDKSCEDISSIDGCYNFVPKDKDKICIYSDGECKEQYKTCELYNTKATSKNQADCLSLKIYSDTDEYFDDSKICSYAGTTCSSRDKTCEDLEEKECEVFKPKDSNKICILSGSNCKSQYKTCELYNENASSKNENDCLSLKIYSDTDGDFDNSKICTYSGTTCSSRDKTCEDLEEDECEDFKPKDSDMICILSGGKCKSQYKTCELYNNKVSSKNEADCLSLKIYSDLENYFDDSQICTYSSGTCSSRDKLCSDIKDESNCENFKPKDTDLICIFDGGKCKSQYKTCELYNLKAETKSESECTALHIYINGKFDTSSECVYDSVSQECSTSKKPCSSFTSSSCSSHIPNDSNKKCAFINNECVEQYKTCELYDTNAANKNSQDCQNISPYHTDYDSLDNESECVFTDSHCTRKSKDCSEISGSTTCIYHTLDDSNKRCIYDNGQCKEVYKSCSEYNSASNKNEAGCKGITVYNYYGGINYNKKCIYEDKTCQEKTLSECSDYESGMNEYYCRNIPSKSYKKCVFENNKCLEEFTDCPGNSEGISEEKCRSIEPSDGYHKCTMDGNKKCVSTLKSCTEYKGTSYDICEYELTHGENKKCFYENGKCIERYIYCSSYTGNNKDECEAIIPYKEGTTTTSLSSTHKCAMETTGCTLKDKGCEEASGSNQCSQINSNLKSKNILDSNKKCKYANNQCLEQYTDCDAYSKSGAAVEKDICEAIILENDASAKCEFVSGTSANTCVKKNKVCSDIKVDDYKDYCPSITLSLGKKCSYSNSACKESNMSCKELENNSGVNEDICSAATTSDSNKKKCVLKSDNSGCQETDKPSSTGNFGPEIKFSLLVMIISLLL